MSFSKFNFKAADIPEKGKTAVFNTLTRGLVVLDNHILESLEKGETSFLSGSEQKSLEDAGVLVPEGMDEDLFFDVYYNQVRFDNTALRITLLTTLSCNFACSYCYEGDMVSGKKQMTGETAEHVISWIKTRALESGASKIRIEYLGGEPLLNIPIIEKIGSEMMKFCESNNSRFISLVISNGYLLNGKTAKRLAAVGVRSVRVTIDGPEAVHNSVRFLRNGGDTYKTIIKNLLEAKEILSISLSGNFTSETADMIPQFLDDLIKAGLGPDVVHKIQFAPVMPTYAGGKAATFDKTCIPVEGFHKIVIKANDELIKRGYGTYAEPEFSPCPVVCSADFTVNYDGIIYKCPCLVGHPEYSIGDVREERSYNSELVRCLGYNTFENDACRNCSVLPLCLGGCRYIALATKGKFHDLDCQKEGLEAITLDVVQRMAKEEI